MLQIRRKSRFNFEHISSNYTKPYGANDITIIFDGNTIKLRSFKGRAIFDADGYNLTDVTIYDDANNGNAEVFTDVNLFKARLISLEYPFQSVNYLAQSTGGVEIVSGNIVNNTDPLNPTVNETITTLTDNGDNTASYVNENGHIVTITLGATPENLSYTITANTNAIAMWNNSLIKVKANATITLIENMPLNYTFVGRVYDGVDVTFNAGNNVTISTESDGTTMTGKGMFTVYKDGADNFVICGDF